MVHQLKYVVGILFAVVLVYSGLWYTAAFDAEKKAATTFAAWRDQGLLVEHGSIASGGFPYRITVSVKDLEVATRRDGLDLTVKDLVLITHLWTPGHWVAEANGVQASLADGTTRFTDDFLHASYRFHENGKTVIVVNSHTLDDFNLTRLMGQDAPALTNWELALMLDNEANKKADGLYGERYLSFKLTGSAADQRLELVGGLSGPVIKDWDKRALAEWRDEGGLLEFDTIDYQLPGGRSKGNASLTLDENFRPLGSMSMVNSGAVDIAPILSGMGLRGQGTTAANGPMSLMLQNGRVMLNNTAIAELKPILD